MKARLLTGQFVDCTDTVNLVIDNITRIESREFIFPEQCQECCSAVLYVWRVLKQFVQVRGVVFCLGNYNLPFRFGIDPTVETYEMMENISRDLELQKNFFQNRSTYVMLQFMLDRIE
ncbi:TPA: hypothetical protein DF272_04055 [Candidatus Falkowbacteria bacterium]|nr:hypothetical protein [Candidatus Falkowbacteria bacterium]